MALVPHAPHLPGDPGQWGSAEPLWKVVPKRDGAGRVYTDFMMMAPGLKGRSSQEMAVVVQVMHGVLARFGGDVVFADFNVDIRVLWVSLQCRPGLMFEVVAALRRQVPELRLVAHHPNQRG